MAGGSCGFWMFRSTGQKCCAAFSAGTMPRQTLPPRTAKAKKQAKDSSSALTTTRCGGPDLTARVLRERTLENGGQLHLVLLKPHTDSVRAHFGGKNVTLHPVDAVDVERALGISAPLPVIANTPFVTGKGECLDVSVIREIEKAGG